MELDILPPNLLHVYHKDRAVVVLATSIEGILQATSQFQVL